MKLENWSVVQSVDGACLAGQVYGHEHFMDGTTIRISAVVGRNGDKVVTHTGSEYELGQAATGYEALYPNARQRVFATIDRKMQQETPHGKGGSPEGGQHTS